MSDFDLSAGLEGVEDVKERDSLGGRLLESGVSDFRIDVAYLRKSKGGAMGMHVVMENSDGIKLTDTQYITSGDKKGNKPYFEKDGKKYPMPGLQHFDVLASLVADKKVAKLEQKTAQIKLYDSEQQKELPTEVITFPELRNQKVKVGVLKIVKNKQVDDGTGKWVDTNEKRELNEVSKYFDADTGATNTELTAKAEPEFIQKWAEKFEGQTLDKFKAVANAPASGATANSTNPLAGGDVNSAADDMFDDD